MTEGGSLALRFVEDRLGEDAAVEISIAQGCTAEIGPWEPGVFELGVVRLGVAEPRALEAEVDEFDTLHHGLLGVDAAHDGLLEAGAAERGGH